MRAATGRSCRWSRRNQLAGGATLYGLLLGAIGASALVGAVALPRLKALLGPDRLVAAGSVGTALALALYGIAREPRDGVAASLIAGISWITVLATLNVSAQFALPEWVRGRGLAVYVTVFFGALTLGSVVWGQVARVAGVPMALFVAAAGAAARDSPHLALEAAGGRRLDLSPSMHWPAPIVSQEVERDARPGAGRRSNTGFATPSARRFIAALAHLSRERRRDGATAGACTRTRPSGDASSRRFSFRRGSNTCASTSG